jgi:hypothetical protein
MECRTAARCVWFLERKHLDKILTVVSRVLVNVCSHSEYSPELSRYRYLKISAEKETRLKLSYPGAAVRPYIHSSFSRTFKIASIVKILEVYILTMVTLL